MSALLHHLMQNCPRTGERQKVFGSSMRGQLGEYLKRITEFQNKSILRIMYFFLYYSDQELTIRESFLHPLTAYFIQEKLILTVFLRDEVL